VPFAAYKHLEQGPAHLQLRLIEPPSPHLLVTKDPQASLRVSKRSARATASSCRAASWENSPAVSCCARLLRESSSLSDSSPARDSSAARKDRAGFKGRASRDGVKLPHEFPARSACGLDFTKSLKLPCN
jgi:hypothetical protein